MIVFVANYVQRTSIGGSPTSQSPTRLALLRFRIRNFVSIPNPKLYLYYGSCKCLHIPADDGDWPGAVPLARRRCSCSSAIHCYLRLLVHSLSFKLTIVFHHGSSLKSCDNQCGFVGIYALGSSGLDASHFHFPNLLRQAHRESCLLSHR